MMTFKCVHKDHRGDVLTEIKYIIHDDSGIHEVMQEFRRFLLAVSFQPETVDKYIEAE